MIGIHFIKNGRPTFIKVIAYKKGNETSNQHESDTMGELMLVYQGNKKKHDRQK